VGWVGCVFFRQPNPTIGFAMRHKNGRHAYSLRPHMTFQFSFFWEPWFTKTSSTPAAATIIFFTASSLDGSVLSKK
jgi:hypothetical protein